MMREGEIVESRCPRGIFATARVKSNAFSLYFDPSFPVSQKIPHYPDRLMHWYPAQLQRILFYLAIWFYPRETILLSTP
jgi:hypothetical protein